MFNRIVFFKFLDRSEFVRLLGKIYFTKYTLCAGVQTAHCTLKLQRTPEHEGGGGNIVPRARWKRLQIGFPEFVANIASNV